MKPVLLAIDNLVFMSSCIEYAQTLAVAGEDLQSSPFEMGFVITAIHEVSVKRRGFRKGSDFPPKLTGGASLAGKKESE